ncbi:TPA: GNAT family N-acetyltransferase [Providencia rettgeri]
MPIYNEFGQPVGRAIPDWSPRPLPQRIQLSGHYCRIEPLSLSHAENLFSAYSQSLDTRNWTWLADEAPHNLSEYQKWVAKVSEKNDPLFFAILDNQKNTAIGVFSLMRIDANNGVIEVGHVHFSPLLSGTVMSTEAHWLLMKYIFETLGYRRYEWKCNSLNARSHRAALRLGFQYEGRFRNALVTKGRNRDTDWFSIIDNEWPDINNAFIAWLSPLNHINGEQIKSLAQIRKNILLAEI